MRVAFGASLVAAVAAWLTFAPVVLTGQGAHRIAVLSSRPWPIAAAAAIGLGVWLAARRGASLAPLLLLGFVLLPWMPLPLPPVLLLWSGRAALFVWVGVAAGFIAQHQAFRIDPAPGGGRRDDGIRRVRRCGPAGVAHRGPPATSRTIWSSRRAFCTTGTCASRTTIAGATITPTLPASGARAFCGADSTARSIRFTPRGFPCSCCRLSQSADIRQSSSSSCWCRRSAALSRGTSRLASPAT